MYPLSGMFSSNKGVLRALKMKWQWVSLVHGPQKVNSCDYILIFRDFWILNLSTSLILFITGYFAHKSVFCYLKCIYKIKILIKAWDSRFPWLVCLSINNNNNHDQQQQQHVTLWHVAASSSTALHNVNTTTMTIITMTIKQLQWQRLSPAPPPSGLRRQGRQKLAQTTCLVSFGP